MGHSTAPATPKVGRHRARWAAIGAAVAVSLGAGWLGVAHATSPDGATTYVPTEPCRIVDTRPGEFHVGPFGTLGGDSKISIDARGSVGECTGSTALPNSATGLQLNVTATRASQHTHLTIYGGSGTPPNASSLNPAPGQPPVPNAVTVELDGNGVFSVYNFQGTVDVVVDVVGHYTDHTHDDRYYTKSQTDDRYYGKAEADDRYLPMEDALSMSGVAWDPPVQIPWGFAPAEAMLEINVSKDAPSRVMLFATAEIDFGPSSTSVACDITTGTTLPHGYTVAKGISAQQAFSRHFSGTVGAGVTTFGLVCHADAAGATITDIQLSAIHQPT